ncbi:family 20 glycosylhydrolase [Tessaracoccus terricola]
MRPRSRLTSVATVTAATLAVTLAPLAPFVQEASAAPNDAPTIIPALQEWVGAEGDFTLSPESRIVVEAETRGVGEQLVTDLAAVTGLELDVTESAPAAGDIVLDLDAALTDDTNPERFAEEGYVLEATAEQLTITAPTSEGVFYGTRTALQGIVKSNGRASFPAGEATDWPDYEVRGFSLDVGRRFFSEQFIRDYISMMSWFKLNEFQIHLNDNQIFLDEGQGWADAYSGFRLASDDPAFAGLASTDGSYDRAEWESFEDVAASHSVKIVPEIDVPAHSLAFVKWDPELGLHSGAEAGIQSDHLDLTDANYDYTADKIKSVFDEFIPWFEGPDVHFGADEYPRDQRDGYLRFFNDMAQHVRDAGKQPRAWGSAGVMHDGDTSGYDKDVIISSWNNGWYGMAAAFEDGYEFVNMNDGTLYVVPFADYYHGAGLNNQGLYDVWYPNRMWDTDIVPAGAPAGAMFAVWNDLVDADYTELGVHGLIRESFAVIAQKTWKAQDPTLSYAAFTDVLKTVGHGTDLQVIEQEPVAANGELSLGADVTASSSTEGNGPENLTDGNMFTRWSSTDDEASFTIDLGENRTVGSVEIDWASPVPSAVAVEVSNDGENWRPLVPATRCPRSPSRRTRPATSA